MVKLTQNSWLGGQMDERMSGRQDMKNYRNGASVLKNFVPVKLGSIRKRPGTDLVCDLTDWVRTRDFRMIPFGYMSDWGFVLIICPEATPKAKVFSDGMVIDVTGYIPYKTEDLKDIGYVQCGDILFLAHKDHPPAEIRHTRDDGDVSHPEQHFFTFSKVVFNPVSTKPDCGWDGSHRVTYTRAYFDDFTFETGDQNMLDICKEHYDPSTWMSGNIWHDKYHEIFDYKKKMNGKTVVNYRASVVINGMEGPLSDLDESVAVGSRYCSISFTSPWTESQVVKIPVRVTIPATVGGDATKSWEIRLYKENGGAYGLVGSFKGTATGLITHTFTDDNIAPDTSVTPIDTTDGTPFSTTDEFPGSVGLYQQRLVWAGTRKDPARIWMSRAGDLYEYRPHDRLQLDDAIDFILPITQFANINFIIELGRLFAFAECAELVIGSASDSAGVSYETIMATEHSHLGCTKRLPPIVANNTLLFVNRTGQSVRDYDEKIGSSRFGGTDVSIFSSSIFADNPIVDWTWQQEPNSTVWCVLKDGRLASFTYDKEQEIGAWAVHELGGSGKAVGIAKTCAVFGRDYEQPTTGEVMVAVKRGGKVTLERMRPWGARGSEEFNPDQLCMDCMCDASESVAGMASVNIGGTSYFGYLFESVMTTMPPMIGDNVGQAQFDVKLGQHAHLRTIGSGGGEIYAVGMGDQASKIDDGAVRDGEDGAAFKDVDVVLAGSNNRDGRVTVRHNEPWPFQLALLELDYEAEN